MDHRMRMQEPHAEDRLDDLLDGGIAVPEWVVRNAQAADGTLPAQPIAAPQVVRRLVAELVPAERVVATSSSRAQSAQVLLTAGLLRDLSAATYADIARTLGRSPSNAKHLVEQHQRSMMQVESYRAAATLVTEESLTVLRTPTPPALSWPRTKNDARSENRS
jgi:hypothetical protein